ncbi:MAG: hypothetical protein K2X82_05580, partial [Gemmataceae bacterium]|nr:hypothetical protein [Gemmataceae bacterium]
GRAAAECGDYVHVANQPTAGELPHPAPKPCDGPSCSGSPATPVLPVTAPTGESSRGHEWAATAEPVAPTAANGHGRLVPADAAVPAHVPQPIFHPPRGR